MPKVRRTQTEAIKFNFINAILAAAIRKDVSEHELKARAFSSYGTGNKRIKHKPGEITLDDLLNMSKVIHIPFDELITTAAQASAPRGEHNGA